MRAQPNDRQMSPALPSTPPQAASTSARARSFRQEVVPSDVTDVKELVASTGFFDTGEIELAGELVDERLARGLRSGYHFLFAQSESKTVGYTCFGPIPCSKSSYDMYWIAVHDALRGQGIGRELVVRTEAIIAQLGGTRIYVDTSSRPQYAPTRRFYTSCGYRVEAELPDFYGPEDGRVIFIKVLGDSASLS
jgi:ribosomal protein S18 acetylase RimI-like enzyme